MLTTTYTLLLGAVGVLVKGDANTVAASERLALGSDGDGRKALADQVLEGVEVVTASNSELHAASAVLLLPPLDELLAGVTASLLRLGPQRLEVAGAKLAVRVTRLGQ